MALLNFSLPYQAATPSPFIYAAADPGSGLNNLHASALPAYNNPESNNYRNEPYTPPANYYQQQRHHQSNQDHAQHNSIYQPYSSQSNQDTRYTSHYNNAPQGQDYQRTQTRSHQQQQQQMRPPPQLHPQQQQQQRQEAHGDETEQQSETNDDQHSRDVHSRRQQEQTPDYPERPQNGYTHVNSGPYSGSGTKTSVHAILDYDDDGSSDYYDDEDQGIPPNAQVTPIQGPIFLRNGSVPVVPLYSYPQLNNGSFVQIPILWTALSVALGVELRGDLVRGAPCIKKYHQLFCPTAGNTYPIDRIERFIDDNKALMRRMYGDFEMNDDYGGAGGSPGNKSKRKRRSTLKHDLPDGGARLDLGQIDPDAIEQDEESFLLSRSRNPRQSTSNGKSSKESGRVDACESKVEIVTPYWASNSAGKVRAIVNTQHFEQAIHQEVCSKKTTNRCTNDCGCEQKYKWHRLLAYDPDNDCKGIFMDWFLFPSCCVCRCDPAKYPPTASTNRNT